MPFSKLVKGFGQFHSKYFADKKDLYDRLTKQGQSPEVLVIACSDSRNDPALLMQSEPGDMFAVRNVAAVVPPYQPDSGYHGTSAAVEFAVKGLGVKDIVVIGHALCGGVRALMDQAAAQAGYEFLGHWIDIGKAARDAVLAEFGDGEENKETAYRALEQAMVLTSLHNLMTFPWIRERVASGSLTLHGWYFDMTDGKMLALDFETGRFTDIAGRSLAEAFAARHSHYCDCSLSKVIGQSKKRGGNL